jgi:hypothetical protein
VLFGEVREIIRRGKASDFFTLTPKFFTSSGSEGVACATRFCTRTLSISTLVPTSKSTKSVKVPSFAFVDFM